jgi:hypothetical protein
MVPAYTGFDINTNYWQGCVFGTAGDEGEVSALMHESMGSSQCAPWRELLDLPPYSLPPWSPWSSAGVDGVAKLLPHTHTNRIRRKLERGAKLNLTAAIRTRGARAIVLLEEVNNILYIYYLVHRSSIKTTRVYNSVLERC